MECFSGTFPSLWPIAAYDLKVLCNFFIELILPNFKSKWYEHLDTSEYIKEWYKGSVSLRCYLCVKSTTLHYNGYNWTGPYNRGYSAAIHVPSRPPRNKTTAIQKKIANRGQWEQGCCPLMATDLGPVRATRKKKKLQSPIEPHSERKLHN